MFRQFTFFVIIILCSGVILAQEIDDLYGKLEKTNDEHFQLEILESIAEYYKDVQVDSAANYFQQVMTKARELGDVQQEVKSIISLADLQINSGHYNQSDSLIKLLDDIDYVKEPRLDVRTFQIIGYLKEYKENRDGALKSFLQALAIAEENKGAEDLIPDILIDLGSFYFQKGDIANSTKNLLRAVDLFKSDDDWENIAVTYLNMAINSMSIEDYENAYDYGLEGLVFAEKSDNQTFIAHSYQVLTASSSELDRYEDAYAYGVKSLAAWEKIGNPYQIGLSNRFIGKVLKKLERVDESIPYLELSRASFQSIEVLDQLLYSELELSESYIIANRRGDGINLLRSVELLLDEAPAHVIDFQNVYKLFENSFDEAGMYGEAYAYRKKHDVIRDSLLNVEKLDRIAQLVTEYEVKEKEAEIVLKESQLSRQRLINIGIGVVALLLFLLFLSARKNIVQRKKVNQELRELDKSKSRFFANLSHELKTPITLILGPLENAIEKVKGQNSIKNDLTLAHKSGNQLLTLVEEIMDLSKLESGKLNLDLGKANLHSVVNRIFFAFESLAEIRKIHMILKCDIPESYMVRLDVQKLEKILNNLLSNAIKFTPENGTVSLEVKHGPNGHVIFEISDTGKGIAEAEMNKIFNRFYQGEDGLTYHGGTGIGLALSKELAHLMNGDLRAKSKPGQGSKFILSIPLESAGDIHTEESKKKIANKEDVSEYEPMVLFAEQPHVLVVEDNSSMRDYLKSILSPHYNLTFAVDGSDGLEKVESQNFDAITCDVMMPNMDGFTFLEHLRNKELKIRTPIVMLTARSLEEDKLNGFALGVDDYITKPFNKKELIARLNSLIANKLSRSEWLNKENEETIDSAEEKMIKNAESLVIENLNNEDYKVTDLASDMNYSQRQLGRILKKLTGLNPSQFIKEIRMKKAYHLLSTRQYSTISEVRSEVGFPHASHFTSEFEKRFGLKPSDV